MALTYPVAPGVGCATSTTRRVTLLAAPALAALRVRFNQPAGGLPTGAVLTWNSGDSTAVATGPNVTHTYLRAGTFRPRVRLSFKQGRCGQALSLPPVTVQEMLIFNIFTPNADGQNAPFTPRLGGCPPRLHLFSRWGQQAYENAAYQNTWDGAGLAAGVYYYRLTPPDGAAIKGWVELGR